MAFLCGRSHFFCEIWSYKIYSFIKLYIMSELQKEWIMWESWIKDSKDSKDSKDTNDFRESTNLWNGQSECDRPNFIDPFEFFYFF